MDQERRHEWAVGLLGAWVVGAVAPDEEAGLRSHLAECETCGAEVVELRDALEGLVDVRDDASQRVWNDILATIHGRVGREAERWLRRRGVPEPIRVALVDDHEDERFLWRASLNVEEDFLVVGEAEDGDAAVDLAVRTRPDVLVLDLVMPGRSGLDVLGRLGTYAPATKVLACSAHEDLLALAVDRGAAGVHLKTTPVQTLPDSLRRLVAR